MRTIARRANALPRCANDDDDGDDDDDVEAAMMKRTRRFYLVSDLIIEEKKFFFFFFLSLSLSLSLVFFPALKSANVYDACPPWRAVLRVKRVKDGSFVATAETVVVLVLVLFERILSPQKREKTRK